MEIAIANKMNIKKYQKGLNIFELVFFVAAYFSVMTVGGYVLKKTNNIYITSLAAIFTILVFSAPTLFFSIKDNIEKRKKNKNKL